MFSKRRAALSAVGVILSSLCVFGPSAGASNVLGNSGFETGAMEPWARFNLPAGANIVVDSSVPHTGAFEMAMSDEVFIGSAAFYQDVDPTPTGSVVELSFWHKRDNGLPIVDPRVNIYYTDNTSSLFSITSRPTDWTHFNITSSLAPNKLIRRIEVRWGGPVDNGSAAFIFFDDFVLDVAPPPACPADLNADGVVGAPDLAQLLGAWGVGASPADLNGDGAVNATDLAQLLGSWGVCA